MFGACCCCKSRTYEPRNTAGQALALSFFTCLTRQTHKKGLSQNPAYLADGRHNSLIFTTNPLQTCSKRGLQRPYYNLITF
jgi:hypothetical protein